MQIGKVLFEAQKTNRHALMEGQVLNEPLKSVFMLGVTLTLQCFHLQSPVYSMLAASAGPLSFRYSTIKTSQRHARQLLQHRLHPRRAGPMQRCMAFDVTLITPEGEKKIQCDEGTLILDAADEAGLDLPYSCRSGSCGTCAAKLASGDMSQIEQVSLSSSGRTATCLVVWLADRHAPGLRKHWRKVLLCYTG